MNAQSQIQPSIVTTLANVLPVLGAVHKNKKNPAFKANYADLSAVLTAIAPIADHGLWFRQVPVQIDGGIGIETFYVSVGGEELSAGVTPIPVNKNDAQALGSAMSYGRRYGLMTAFGLSAEDDDGNAAVAGGHSKESAVSPRQPDLISEDDYQLVMKLCEAVGDNQPAAIMAGYSIRRVADLPADKAPSVIKRLKEKLADKAKAETNAKTETTFGELIDDEIPY